MSVYLYGNNGRIGRVLLSYLNATDISIEENACNADIIVLATPYDSVEELLSRHPEQSILDMSGYCKRHHIGSYGLNTWPVSSRIVQNIGCFASSVIIPLQQAGIVHQLSKDVQIHCTGGGTTVSRKENSVMRLARRLWDHPHQEEIERVFPSLSISHFIVNVNTQYAHGIWTCISGFSTAPLQEQGGDINGVKVLGSPSVHWNVRTHQCHFVLCSALDNLHYPAFHAISLLKNRLRILKGRLDV